MDRRRPSPTFSSWRSNAMRVLNWPARISAQMAASSASIRTMHIALEAAVREHLQGTGRCSPAVD